MHTPLPVRQALLPFVSLLPAWGRRGLRTLPVLVLLLLLGQSRAGAQTASTYVLTPSAGTFTALSGATTVAALAADAGTTGSVALGLNFVFEGTTYTTFRAFSDGYLSFGTNNASLPGNNLNTVGTARRPVIAPLWDDMDGSSGTFSYLTTGTTGSRIFTAQWLNWKWDYSASAVSISFQVKLYEGTNKIEFIYRPESGAVGTFYSGASIGLSGATSGNFLSLNNTSTNPSASSATETNSISTKPASGQTYAFTPPVAQTYTSSTVTQVTGQVGAGQVNQAIVGLQIVTAGTLTPLSLTTVNATTAGTTSLGDISNARLYYTGTSSAFATTNQFGSDVATPGTTLSFTGTRALAPGTNYFWLTYDIAAGAASGNAVDATVPNFVLSTVTRTPTVTAPAGNRTIVGALAGSYTIDNTQPTGGTSTLVSGAVAGSNYANFTDAVTDLNGRGVSATGAAVTFNVVAGQQFTEPGLVPTIITSGTVAKPITFQKNGSGANPQLKAVGAGAGIVDAGLGMTADYLTFDGIDVLQNSGTALEFGYALFRATATDGTQNITIRNATVTLSKSNVSSVGIYSAATDATGTTVITTSTAGANSNNTLINNTVTNAYTGIYLNGVAGFPDQNNTIGGAGAVGATTGNTVTNFGNYGIRVARQGAAQVGNNTVNNLTGGSAAGAALYGISTEGGTGFNGDVAVSYNSIDLTQGGSFLMYGVRSSVASTATTNTTSITQNTIGLTVLNAGATALTGDVAGVLNTGSTGSIAITNNTVSFTATLNAAGNFSGATYGVYNTGTASNTGATAATLSNNTFSWIRTGSGSGSSVSNPIAAVYNDATVTGTLTISNNVWGPASGSALVANAGPTYLISNNTSTNNIVVANNTWQNLAFTGTSSNTWYGYYNFGSPTGGTQTLSGNTMSNLDVSNGGLSSGSFYGLYTNTATAQSQAVTGNTVGTITAGTGTLYGIYATTTPATSTFNTNTVSTFYTYSGTSTQYGLYLLSGAAQVQGNNVSGLYTNGTGSVYGIYATGMAGTINTNTINTLTIDNPAATSTAIVAGIYNNSASSSAYANSVTSIGGQGTNGLGVDTNAATVYGLYTAASTAAAANNVYGNTINTIFSTGPGVVYGLYLAGSAATTSAYGHSIYDISSGTGTAYGIYTNGTVANTLSLYQNKVYGVGLAGASGTVYGLYLNGGAASTVNAYNNLLGLSGRITGQTSLAASGSNVVNGIGVAGAAAMTSNLSFNTVYLAGASGGTNFGGSALYVSTATPVLNLRNNILVNILSAAGTGSTVSYRRSAAPTATNAPLATNDYNLYYAGTPGAANLLYGEGTTSPPANSQQTLAAYQAYVTTRDSHSVTDFVNFLSSVGSSADFLHINAATDTQVESGGINISGITADYDNVVRAGNTGYTGSGSAPDLGADEGDFVPKDLTAPAITYTALGNTGSTSNRTLVVTITDASGVATGAGAPLIYYRKGTSGSFYSAVATSVSGSSYTFTIDYANVTGGSAVANDVIQYYVAAQDNAATPNSGTSPIGGGGLNPPGSTAPATFNSYVIIPSLAGIYYVGSSTSPDPSRTYPTLTAAITNAAGGPGLVGYNNAGLTGAVTFYLLDATYTNTTETFPITVAQNTSASATNTLTIKPYTGIAPAFTAASATALIKLNRAAYVTLDGSNTASGTSRDWSLTNNNTAGSAVLWVASTGVGQGSTNIVLQNLDVMAGSTTAITYGLNVSGATLGSNGADNDNLTVQNLLIRKAYYGIYAAGTATASAGGLDGLVLSGNLIGSAADDANIIGNTGVYLTNAVAPVISSNKLRYIKSSAPYGFNLSKLTGATVSGNEVRNMTTTGSTGTGLLLGATVTNAVVDGNSLHDFVNTTTFGYGSYGLQVATATASSNVRVSNNLIYNFTGDGYTSLSGSSHVGIYLTSAMSGVQVVFNTVDLTGALTYTGAISAALGVESGPTGLTVQNNIFSNNMTGGTAFALYSNAPKTAYTAIDYNDYYPVLSYIGSNRTTLAALRTGTGQDVSSQSVDPGFAQTSSSPFDLTPSASALNNAALTIAGVTTDYTGATRGAAADIGAIEFAPVMTDIRPTVLVAPAATGCYGSAQALTVRLNNNGTSAHDFGTNPTTITVTATPPTGPAQVFTTTVSSNAGNPGGTALAAGADRDVTLPGTLNMAASGSYSFAIATVTTGDGRPSNDNLTVTRSVGPAAVLPQTLDFATYDGTNLSTLYPGWREADGATTPNYTDSDWYDNDFGNDPSNPRGTSAYFEIYSFNTNLYGWIVSPRLYPVTATSELKYDLALTRFGMTTINAANKLDADDVLEVRISTDCGATFSTLRAYGNSSVISTSGQTETISLSAYAGQQVMIAFVASEGPTGAGDTDVFIDNIDVRTPTTVDLAAVDLATPTTTATCYSTTETLTATVKNASNSTALNFASTNATVTVVVTPPSGPTQSFTTTLTTGTLAANATQNVVLPGTLDMSALGTYSFAITATVAGDQNTLNDALAVSPTRTAVLPTAGAVSPATQNVCYGSTVTLTLAGSTSGTIYWQQASSAGGPFTDVMPAATGATYSPVVTANTYFRAQARCNSNVATSTSVAEVLVDNPQPASATAGPSVCEGNTTTVTVTKTSGQISAKLYAAATGGTALTPTSVVGNVSTYTTAPLAAGTTNYYATATTGGSENVGKPAQTSTGLSAQTAGALYFTTTQALTIQTVTVYLAAGAAAGTVTIDLRNGNSLSGTIVGGQSTAFAVPANATSGVVSYVVPLNYTVPAAGSYTLYLPSATQGGLLRDFDTDPATVFPYTSPSGTISITGSSVTTYYYYFYNWSVSAACEGGRLAVPVVATPAPAFAIAPGTTQTICAGNSVGVTGTYTPGDYDTFVYTANTSAAVAGVSQASTVSPTATLTPTATTSYTVTASNSAGGPGSCQAIRMLTVNVNPTPAAPVVTPATATVCLGSSQTLATATSGTTVIGTGTTITANNIDTESPYGLYYQGGRVQYLVPASELLAAGLVPGAALSSVVFDVSNLPSPNPAYTNFTIRLTTTTATALTTNYLSSGLMTVVGPTTYTTTLGLNTHTFATPYAWDGNNLVVDVSFRNTAFQQNTRVRYTATAYNSVTYYHNDTDLTPSTTATGSTSLKRPNMQFAYSLPYTYNWTLVSGDGLPMTTNTATITVMPTVNSVYRLTATNSSSCPKSTDVPVNVTTTTTWAGNAATGSKTDWFNALNWSACLPSATISALVPTGLTTYPILTTGTAVANNLTIQGGGSVTISNAAATLDLKGNLTTATATSLTATAGMVKFSNAGAQSIGAATLFNVLIAGTPAKTLAGALTINNNLDLTAGSLDQGNFNLTMGGSTGTVTGASTAFHVIQSGTGRFVVANVGSGAGTRASAFFPIGTSASSYSPATLTNPAPGTTDSFSANLLDGVRDGGLTGTPVTGSAVQKTWDISEGTPGGSNASITLQWNTADQGSGFNGNRVDIVHFTGGAWQPTGFATYTPATSLGSGDYSVTRNGYTSFSPFGVQDDSKPLPVSLTRFEATRKGHDAELTWATASEKDNAGFEVQVSADGKEFRRLHFTEPASPNSSSPRSYGYTDREAGKAGLRYYRLRQVDVDGTASYSPVRMVDFGLASEMSLSAAPNPFGRDLTLTVALPIPAADAHLTITDATGRIIHQQRFDLPAGGTQVKLTALEALTSGIYLLHLTTGSQPPQQLKVVKQ